MSYLDELNPAQRAAVEHTEGPMMIIAGAGSGKTRVLTYRITHLIQKGVSPFHILALTFTNKAAREMQHRISSMVGYSDAQALWMGTFHSVFAKILRSEAHRLGYPSNFTIYDSDDSLRLLTQVIKDLQLDKEIYKPRQIQGRISSLKNNLVTINAYQQHPECSEADEAARRPKFLDVYRQYVERCFKAGAMDFDDLLLRTNELLARFPEVLAKYQERFRYILVDEYQDTNHSQYLIVKALADLYQNICVVGDDSQSIYSFRGANIANILHFNRDYPNSRVFKLEQNYRSTGNIVAAAGSVIKKNRDRLEKEVWTSNNPGEKVRVARNLSDGDEAYYIARTIKGFKEEDTALRNDDFAVLYRTNAQSRAIEDALRRYQIPYRIWGGQSFYARKEIKDALAYLRLAVNPKDEEALLRVINYPARGIGDTTLNKLTVAANHYGRSVFEVIKALDKLPQLGLNAGTSGKLDAFAAMIEAFGVYASSEDAFSASEKILRESGLVSLLSTATDPEEAARYENVQELANSIKDFVESQKEMADADPSLSAFVQEVALLTDMDRGEDSDSDKVALMTVHMAKGLEFNTVFVSGLEENLFPSLMASSSREEIEEERRLFYVALTRARERAILTYAQQRYRWGKLTDGELSRFIDEIDPEYLEYSVPREMRKVFSSYLDASLFGDAPSGGAVPFRRAQTAKLASNAPAGPRNLRPVAAARVSGNEGETDLSPGQRVRHERFGQGTVRILEGKGSDAKATIDFDGIGEKKMLLKFAKIQKLDPR